MAEKISARMEDMRVQVAQNMFKSPVAEETEEQVDEEVEEELTLEDYSIEEIQEFMQTEDFEQLDELSKKTLGSYVKTAADAKGEHEAEHSYINRHGYVDDEDQEDNDRLERNIDNRTKGIARAAKKLSK
jgi:hypothetical protein